MSEKNVKIGDVVAWADVPDGALVRLDDYQQAAERLHAAGWRPGMTAEDAARRLAEAERPSECEVGERGKPPPGYKMGFFAGDNDWRWKTRNAAMFGFATKSEAITAAWTHFEGGADAAS